MTEIRIFIRLIWLKGGSMNVNHKFI